MGGIEDLIIQRIISSITWANISWALGIFIILMLALKSWVKRWWFRWKWRPTDDELAYLLDLLELEEVGGLKIGGGLSRIEAYTPESGGDRGDDECSRTLFHRRICLGKEEAERVFSESPQSPLKDGF